MSMESHGGDDAACAKLLTHPPEPSGNITSRIIWEKVGGMEEGARILRINI
jgi:hypothetical protein